MNGDANRGLFVGNALYSLHTWYQFLRPDYGRRPDIFETFASACMSVVAQVPKAALVALAHLSWHESQRAEYLADALSARIAGTDAAVSALDKLRYGATFANVVQRLALNDGGDLFGEIRRRLIEAAATTAPKKADASADRYRLDQSHPPTDYRLTFLGSRPVETGKLLLSAADQEELEAELAALSPPIQKQLTDRYLRYLYR